MPCKPRVRWPRSAPRVSYSVPALCRAYAWPQFPAPQRDGVVAVISLGGGVRASDLAAAAAHYDVPAPNVQSVSVQGATNTPGSDADAENALDCEVSGAAYASAFLSPRALTVLFVSAPNTDAGFVAAIQQAVAAQVDAISISWGSPENNWSAAAVQAMNAALQAAHAAGIPVCVASGDNDSGDGESGAHVDFPASSPFAIGCGGTSKTGSAEVVWSDGRNGTGGGFSALFPAQSFQIGAPAGPGRMVPDVAGNADPATGYEIVLNGGLTVIGGTSAVAPLWAGLLAALKVCGAAGDVLANLWKNPVAFTDVTGGNNGKWRAGVGPDPCTGLGVPIGSKLATALIVGNAPPPPPVPVSPPAKLGTINIDLDAQTYAVPSEFRPAAGAPALGTVGTFFQGLITEILATFGPLLTQFLEAWLQSILTQAGGTLPAPVAGTPAAAAKVQLVGRALALTPRVRLGRRALLRAIGRHVNDAALTAEAVEEVQEAAGLAAAVGV